MLLQFSVTNHRSIKETAIISMKAAADKTMKEILISPDGKKELVPVMAIYGANAAGKSNVIHALLLMREMVCGSFAKPLKGDELPYPDEGDMIWCVFDRDDNTNAMLSKAKQVAIKEGYQIAFSNPSFEVWFLLHFNNQTTPVENCEAAIKLLKKKGRLEQYEGSTAQLLRQALSNHPSDRKP